MKEVELTISQRLSELEAELALLREQDYAIRQRVLDLEVERFVFEKQRHKDLLQLEYDKMDISSPFNHDLGC